MSLRLAPVVVLLLAACAAWDTSSPNQGPPPADTPTPSSRYAPPPPARPGDPGDPEPEIRVAIASVQLLDDCPEPEAERAARADNDEEAKRSGDARSWCSQSTVQMALGSDRAGPFRIEAVRVLDGAKARVAGSSRLRAPTRWDPQNASYLPWDEQIAAGGDLKISYKLGLLDLSGAGPLVGSDFNVFSGPFVLELDVSVGGVRRTVRSPQFVRQNDDMVET
jgi:hypothetical protein